MKFSVIAATTFIASASAAVGEKKNLEECAVWNDCVTDNSCVAITKVTDADGVLKNACILTTKCTASEVITVSTDSKKYDTKKDGCLKDDSAAAKKADGAKCAKSSECATDLKCGGNGEASAYMCLGKAKCGTKMDDKDVVCESSIRNAISMAVAAVAVAYAL